MKRLILSLVLIGCGVDESSSDYRRILYRGPICEEVDNGPFLHYVIEFRDMVEKATGVRPTDKLKSISYVTTSQDNLWGTCYTWSTKKGEIMMAKIELDPNLSNKSKVLERTVVLHELGHCIMNDDHVKDANDLMNPTVSMNITEEQANARIEHYMARLARGE